MNNRPRLRDSKKRLDAEPFPLNKIPDNFVISLGSYFVYLLYTGRTDFTGTDWGNALAYASGGTHLDSPVGIADVISGKMAWSAKTVKASNPFSLKTVRLISGRCSPDYSYGITDPHSDIAKTGEAVLNIWNERINIAYDHYNPVRSSILIRSDDLVSFILYEEENHRYRTSDFSWESNANGNLIGKNRKSGEICFTWQPHGSQLTIHSKIPVDAIRFKIKHPVALSMKEVLTSIGFDSSWIQIVKNAEQQK